MRCTLQDGGPERAVAVLQCDEAARQGWEIALLFASPVLILLSIAVASASAFIAYRNLQTTARNAIKTMDTARDIARQRATLDLIEKSESSDGYRNFGKAFGKAEREDRFEKLADPKNEEERELRRGVFAYLNHYELIAVGIKHEVLDQTIYREWMQTHVVREWNAAAPLIQNERWRLNQDKTDYEYQSQLFKELQAIACAWSGDAENLSEGWGPKPPLPIGPALNAEGDFPLPNVEPADAAPREDCGTAEQAE